MKMCRGVMGRIPSALLLLYCVLMAGTIASYGAIDPDAQTNYKVLADSIDSKRLSNTISALSGIKYTIKNEEGGPDIIANSRMAGTPGGDQAADYVNNQLAEILGKDNVRREQFNVTIPVDHGASIIMKGSNKPIALRSLWPNLVRTSTLPKNGVSGKLVYAGRGELRAFRGKDVDGSIVLMDFNCGTKWLNAPRLGAKAIIFVEPSVTMRGEAEAKFVGIPVSIPRFWISQKDAAVLQEAALTTPNVEVTLNANIPWEAHPAYNIIGVLPGTDKELSKQVIIIETYYDSMSVVPTLAPGAENASGIASMLEIARAFKANRPKRTVWFVASGGHFLGIEGARQYVDKHLDEWSQASIGERFSHFVSFGNVPLPKDRKEVLLFSGLDLSTQSKAFGVFYKGYFYDSREDIQSDYADIGRTLRENAAKIGLVLGFDPNAAFGDGINQVNGKGWRNYLPGHFAFDAEAAMMAGGRGITFASTDDTRQFTDTPKDTVEQLNIANLRRQTRLLVCEYWHILNDTNNPDKIPAGSLKSLFPVQEWPAWSREGLRLGFTTLNGSSLLFDPKENFVPDKKVKDSLAVVSNPSKTMVGVRGNLIQITDTNIKPDPKHYARYRFVGMPLVISGQPYAANGLRFGVPGQMHIAAYHIHENDDIKGNRGDIDYAPDLGMNGAENYPLTLDMTGSEKNTQVIMFECVSTSIYDLIDQQALKALTGVTILDAASDSQPRQYGYALAGNEPGVSYVEDVAVLFTSIRESSRLKVIMDSGPAATRFLLINSKAPTPGKLPTRADETNAIGLGYAVGVTAGKGDNESTIGPLVSNGAITKTALRVAMDMWALDDYRLRTLAKYRIINEALMDVKNRTGLHDIAAEKIELAKQAYLDKDFDTFDSYSRQAWAYEARVYPQAQSIASDVVQGVIFYLFLLIPFAFFLERLLIASRDLNRQLLSTFLIFIVVYFIFSQIHPAFDITINPMIVLIAFVMLALSVFVSTLVWGKFEEQINEFRKTISGVHKTDVGKASIAFAAFTLGISNMRRRRERTTLTCITLVLLTFTVLSFTSVVSRMNYNDRIADGTATYNGILLRAADWSALQEPAYRLFNDEFGHTYNVAPRSWFTGAPQGQASYLQVRRAQASIDLKGVVGLTPEEEFVTKPSRALLPDSQKRQIGRWFNASDTYSVILPKDIADALGVSVDDVGKAKIDFSGVPYLVIGIIDSAKFDGIKDLDSEALTPVDFTSAQNQSGGGQAKSAYQAFIHLDTKNVILVPYNTLVGMGGDIRSVAINFKETQTVKNELKNLMPRIDMNIYAGVGGVIHRFSAIEQTKSTGLATIIIPILIASLIVLNTMLGSVYERVKEIRTFSSVGLSPSNIAMLFIAEALVYGIIGAVSGYLIGQTISKIISALDVMKGLNLNFSSTSAEISIGVVVLVVLLSTIFPARKASEVATPSLDRTWRVPEPDGDVWTIPLPFAVTGNQVKGINGFLAEWFKSYEEQSVGDFLTQGVTTETTENEYGLGYKLSGRVWLAPFDLGVSQDFTLLTTPTELESVYHVTMVLDRVSGDVSNWKRINRRFLNVTRRQFLIWRTLSEAEHNKYLNDGGLPASAPSVAGAAS